LQGDEQIFHTDALHAVGIEISVKIGRAGGRVSSHRLGGRRAYKRSKEDGSKHRSPEKICRVLSSKLLSV
jgi:hypothetical protein